MKTIPTRGDLIVSLLLLLLVSSAFTLAGAALSGGDWGWVRGVLSAIFFMALGQAQYHWWLRGRLKRQPPAPASRRPKILE